MKSITLDDGKVYLVIDGTCNKCCFFQLAHPNCNRPLEISQCPLGSGKIFCEKKEKIDE